MPVLYVINPNSLHEVTARIAQALASCVPSAGGPVLRCVTLEAGPPGIVSQRDADRAAPLVADFVAAQGDAAGFVIACYSDPGLHAAREASRLPVLGIGQAALATAVALGERVGVIAVSSAGIARHWRAYRAQGLAPRIAGERAIDLSVAESGDRAVALRRLIETGRALRDQDGADVIVLGCAGMASLVDEVQAALGVPVIEPCRAAVTLALARIDAACASR